jgi:hypothetical protein
MELLVVALKFSAALAGALCFPITRRRSAVRGMEFSDNSNCILPLFCHLYYNANYPAPNGSEGVG